MRAGELRHRITLQEKCVALNGFGEEVITWSAVATVWAQIETPSASEFVSQAQMGALLTHKITIRQRANIIPTMRITWGVRVFEITGVVADNLKRQIALLCRELNDGVTPFVVATSAVGGSGAIQ